MAIDNIHTVMEPSPKRLRTEGNSYNITTDISEMHNDQSAMTVSNEAPSEGPSRKLKVPYPEYLKLKQTLRERSNKLRALPQLRLRDIGTAASLSVSIDNRVPIFLSDIQHLIMYSLIGVHSPYSPAKWCQLVKYPNLQNTNILIVENVSMYDYINNETSFPFTGSTFDIKLEFLNPQGYRANFIQDLLMVPVTNTQMRKFINLHGSLQDAVQKTDSLFDLVRDVFPAKKENNTNQNHNLPVRDKFSRVKLLLSAWQMVEENYPLPIKGLMEKKYSDYVTTKDVYEAVTPTSPLFGVDCEMCMTTSGDLELARVSIVDEKHRTLYDSLVKPDNPITDYLTRFSGITPKMMKPVTTKLKDVQEYIRKTLPADAILVGQSLNGDFHALKIMHPYVIDTSVIYNVTGERNRKTKLKTLTKEFLHENIQVGNKGHCSTEDSLASLKLVQLKLAKHLRFGDAVTSNIQYQVRPQDDVGNASYAISMLRHIAETKEASVVGIKAVVDKYSYLTYKNNLPANGNINFTSAQTNKSVVNKLCTSMKSYDLNIGHVKLTDVEEDKESLYLEVDNWIQEVYRQSGAPSLNIVLFSGNLKASNGCCFLKLRMP